MSAEHALAVGDAFGKAGLGIPWGGYFTPVAFPDGFYDRLAANGLAHVEFGTDSLCDPVLQAYRKPFNRAQALAAHRAAVAANLHVAHFFVLGGPGETADTVTETLAVAEQLDRAALFFFCGLRIYPNTELEAQMPAAGRRRAEEDPFSPWFYEPECLSLEQMQAMVEEKGAGRINWIAGGGGELSHQFVARLHARGHAGPQWERLIPSTPTGLS